MVPSNLLSDTDVETHGRQAAQTAAQDGEEQEPLTFGRGKTKEKEVEPFSDGSGAGLAGGGKNPPSKSAATNISGA